MTSALPFLTDCLSLFDQILRAMWSVPVLRFFLALLAWVSVLALVISLTRAAKPDGR